MDSKNHLGVRVADLNLRRFRQTHAGTTLIKD